MDTFLLLLSFLVPLVFLIFIKYLSTKYENRNESTSLEEITDNTTPVTDSKVYTKTKRCPYCGEEILEIAKKCKHCGEFFDESSSEHEPPSYRSEVLGIMVLVIPVIAFFGFWIYEPDAVNHEISLFICVIPGMILLTAILASIEASMIGMGKGFTGRTETGPVTWFFSFLLFWPIAYPAYLYQRSKFGLHNYCIGGILIMLIFISPLLLPSIFKNLDSSANNKSFFSSNVEELEHWVKISLIDNTFEDPDYAGLAVGEVSLIKESSSKYTGFVEYKWKEETESVRVEVTSDGRKTMYSCDPPRDLIMKIKMKNFSYPLSSPE
jgi:uncharacterized protein (DUF983 family)